MDKIIDAGIQNEKSDNKPQRKRRSAKLVLPENVWPRMSPIIEIARKEGMSILDLCKKTNLSKPGIYLKLANDDCRLSDFEKLAKALGYEVRITLKRKYTKKAK